MEDTHFFTSKSLTLHELKEAQREIARILGDNPKAFPHAFPRVLESQTSFEEITVIFEASKLNEAYAMIRECFKPQVMMLNLFSFGEYAVRFTITSNIAFALFTTSFQPFGVLMRMLMRAHNLHLRFGGLYHETEVNLPLHYYDECNKDKMHKWEKFSTDFLLSASVSEVCRFLGLKEFTAEDAPRTAEDVFGAIFGCKHFDPRPFAPYAEQDKDLPSHEVEALQAFRAYLAHKGVTYVSYDLPRREVFPGGRNYVLRHALDEALDFFGKAEAFEAHTAQMRAALDLDQA